MLMPWRVALNVDKHVSIVDSHNIAESTCVQFVPIYFMKILLWRRMWELEHGILCFNLWFRD